MRARRWVVRKLLLMMDASPLTATGSSHIRVVVAWLTMSVKVHAKAISGACDITAAERLTSFLFLHAFPMGV